MVGGTWYPSGGPGWPGVTNGSPITVKDEFPCKRAERGQGGVNTGVSRACDRKGKIQRCAGCEGFGHVDGTPLNASVIAADELAATRGNARPDQLAEMERQTVSEETECIEC